VWIDRLVVTPPVVAAQDRIDHDRSSIVQRAHAVVAQDHRKGNPLRVCGNPTQREEVVPVQAGMRNLHSHPTFARDGLGLLADLQRRQRIIGPCP
jgi:hypothetical protein